MPEEHKMDVQCLWVCIVFTWQRLLHDTENSKNTEWEGILLGINLDRLALWFLMLTLYKVDFIHVEYKLFHNVLIIIWFVVYI